MASSEIYLQMREDVTSKLKNMAETSKRTKMDLNELQNELNELGNTKLNLQSELKKATNELKEFERQSKKAGQTDQEVWKQKQQQVNRYKDALKQVNTEINSVNKTMNTNLQASTRQLDVMRQQEGQMRRNNSVGFGSTAGKLLGAQYGQQLIDGGVGFVNANMTSLLGTTEGNRAGNILGGVASGAMVGSMIAPGIGTAIGAALGGLTGVINNATDKIQKNDEKFKEYAQETYNDLNEFYGGMATRGTSIAGQRERDKLGFDTLLKGDSTKFMQDLVGFASKTPFAYGDLTTMTKSGLTGFNQDQILEVIRKVGDAGSALNIDTAGMNYMTQSLSRMNNSNKFTLENFNAFNDRGINVGKYLGDAYGKDIGQIYEMISKGLIKGKDAVNIILSNFDTEFGGSMERMSATYDGLMSTYEDSLDNLDAIAGEAYNEGRKEQLAKNTELNDSNILKDMATYKGTYQAELENMQDELRNKALQELEKSKEYESASAEEKGRMILEAETQAKMDYMQTAEYKAWQENQIADYKGVAETIADYGKKKYYSIGQAMAAEMTKGFNAYNIPKSYTIPDYTDQPIQPYDPRMGMGYAYGINYVPYDNYSAKLHEGERVLTAAENREFSKSNSTGIAININGLTVREEADIEKIALELSKKIRQVKLKGVM